MKNIPEIKKAISSGQYCILEKSCAKNKVHSQRQIDRINIEPGINVRCPKLRYLISSTTT